MHVTIGHCDPWNVPLSSLVGISLFHEVEASGSSGTSVFILPEQLIMAAIGAPKTSAHIYRTACSHIPEDSNTNMWAYISKRVSATTVWRVFLLLMEQNNYRHLRVH